MNGKFTQEEAAFWTDKEMLKSSTRWDIQGRVGEGGVMHGLKVTGVFIWQKKNVSLQHLSIIPHYSILLLAQTGWQCGPG